MKLRTLAAQFIRVVARSNAEKLARVLAKQVKKGDDVDIRSLLADAQADDASATKMMRTAVKLIGSSNTHVQQVGQQLAQALQQNLGEDQYSGALRQLEQIYRDKRLIHAGSVPGLPITALGTVVGLAAGGAFGLFPLAALTANVVAYKKTAHANRRLGTLAALQQEAPPASETRWASGSPRALSTIDEDEEDLPDRGRSDSTRFQNASEAFGAQTPGARSDSTQFEDAPEAFDVETPRHDATTAAGAHTPFDFDAAGESIEKLDAQVATCDDAGDVHGANRAKWAGVRLGHQTIVQLASHLGKHPTVVGNVALAASYRRFAGRCEALAATVPADGTVGEFPSPKKLRDDAAAARQEAQKCQPTGSERGGFFKEYGVNVTPEYQQLDEAMGHVSARSDRDPGKKNPGKLRDALRQQAIILRRLDDKFRARDNVETSYMINYERFGYDQLIQKGRAWGLPKSFLQGHESFSESLEMPTSATAPVKITMRELLPHLTAQE